MATEKYYSKYQLNKNVYQLCKYYVLRNQTFHIDIAREKYWKGKEKARKNLNFRDIVVKLFIPI